MMTRSPARMLKKVSLCSSLAIATALVLGPSPATAQSFEAPNPTGSAITNGGVVTTSPGITDIALNGGQTVIDWTPSDAGPGPGGIGFQYGGTATFHSTTNFAVLNRIVPFDPTRIIAMDGNILSTVNGQTGGAVYFYSPAGIVLGPNAFINVGSLVLTTSPIEVSAGQFIGGNDGTTVTFGNANPNSYVFTNPGSRIQALNGSSYVAMVAPRVGHDGTINVNGSAALVAAEAATISFNADGLFNITVDVGTDEDLNEGIVVNGTITGPVSSGAGDYHRAYLVAVPKNSLLTMVIGSGADLGFEIAGAANVVGNAVILSAGHDISFGNTSDAPSAAAGALANISVTNSNFTSALYGSASGEALVGANAAGSSTFASDVSLRAGGRVRFFSENPGSTVTVGGNLTLSADAEGLNEGDSATAGIVQLMASGGGKLSVLGSTQLTAIGRGGPSSTAGIASGDGTGGTILVQSTTGGDMDLGNELTDTFTADASGHGGSFFTIDGFVDGGDGFGGTVNVFTSGGSAMILTGAAGLSANGTAGQPSDCFQCGGVGGIGDAGNINVQAHTGPLNTMAFGNGLTISANGLGGSGQSGGLGDGGDVIVTTSGQSTLTVTGNLWITASGDGGNASGASGVIGNGGDGFGGDSDVSADNGTLTITGSFDTFLSGDGGNSELGNGGYGQGGFGELFAWNGGNAAVGGYFSSIRADGTGGDGLTGGGEGQGGSAYMSSSSGGTLAIGSYASLIANGEGGRAYDVDNDVGNGGLGEGGHVEAYANDATLDMQGTLVLSADGSGGSAGGGRDAGDSLGGDVYLQAVNGGDLSVAGGLYATAVGNGDYISSTTNSGDGTGGTINIFARDGDSTLTVSGLANLNADGIANQQGECFPCGGIGGIGRGGTIIVASQGATGDFGNVLAFGNALTATANGYGGGGVGGAAGDGFGGTVSLSAQDGNTVNIVGDVTLVAIGYGGDDFGGFVAGDGIGGLARVISVFTGANLTTIGGNVTVDASGYGGDSGGSASGTGGNGTGGRAHTFNTAGTITIAGDFTARAEGYGGDSDGATGVGGDGFGEFAAILADGGDTTIAGSAFVSASGYGGNGFVGGDGFGGGQPSTDDGAFVFANNGNISIGVGGVETGAFVEADGYGGAGNSSGSGQGGTGGDGTGGFVAMVSGNSDLGPSSITAPFTYLSATGQGGNGGGGGGGGSGFDGGDGGIGTGGTVQQTAAAGNGLLEIGDAFINVSGFGGDGGDGGSADGGTGGNGGNGGAAFGGIAYVGTSSGAPSIAQSGVGNFNSITVDASATGGNGGNGGIFGLPDGNGGNGGSATGGTAILQARGSTLNVNSVGLVANATGGNGGSGAIAGAGGDAETDEVGVIVTERVGDPAIRGQLNAGSIIGTLNAVGGSGSIAGLSRAEGGSYFIVRNSDASIGSVNISVVADAPIADLATDAISIINGEVTVANDFTFITPGNMSLFADSGVFGGSMNVGGTLTLTAGNFVPDVDNEPPANAGTYFANLISITSNLNIYTTANLDSILGLNLNAAGFIVTGNLNGNSGDVFVDAQGGLVDVGNVTGGFVNIQAFDSVNADDLTSDSNIQVTAGADMYLGNLFAGVTIDPDSNKAVRLNADGSINVGNVTALGGIDFDATGSVTGLDLVSGEAVYATADGAISFGDISSGLIDAQPPTGDPFSVGMGSLISISVGDVAAANGIIFVTFGALTTGDLNAGSDILTLAGGDMLLGAISAGPSGRTYLADVSMWVDAGGNVGSGNSNVDPEVIFAAPPVATAGSITIGGPVSTGQFRAAAGADLNAGQISAQGIHGRAGGTATIGGLWSAGSVDLASNDINILVAGGISATGSVALFSSNASQALIGDGLTGSGYALSNAEFGRIEGGSVFILARGDGSAAQDMLIGDLTVTGPLAGSTIESSDGILVFATGDIDAETPSGVIRVVGDVIATGFGSGNAIEFYADRFELDAATGGISITSSGGALSGELGLYADRIHVASGAILDQLAVNPQYTGYQQDLNAPAAVQRPEGVLNAAVIWIESDNLRNILIQNTGTEETPAGFLTQEIFVNDDEEIAGPPGSIDVVVNGQLQTEGGTLTGVAVRDALVEGEVLTPFTANSTINGCLLTGACGVVPPPPPPPPRPPLDPVGGISTAITLISADVLDEQPFGNEPIIDDEVDGAKDDESSSPIAPPAPLFDTRPLNPDANIDEPISGSGNPALTGAGPINNGDDQ